jgi:hypothetical protein
MSEDIDIRVTPSLHPINVREIDGYDADTETLLGLTEGAFAEAYQGLTEIHDARIKAAANPTWTEAQQLVQVDDFAQAQVTRITGRLDSAAANLQTVVTSIEHELTAPVENKSAGLVSTEIRAHVKALKDKERFGFVRAAIISSDTRTATAILGAPSYLSGLTTEMQEVLTRMFHEHHSPVQAKRLKAAKGALDLIGERKQLILSEKEKAVGAPAKVIAKMRAAKLAAETAVSRRDA